MTNIFYMNRIALIAKQRVNDKTRLKKRLIVLREVLQQFNLDYDITEILSGKNDSFTATISNSEAWIQLFPGKGIEKYCVCARIITQQEMRKAKLKQLFDIEN